MNPTNVFPLSLDLFVVIKIRTFTVSGGGQGTRIGTFVEYSLRVSLPLMCVSFTPPDVFNVTSHSLGSGLFQVYSDENKLT